MSGYGRYESHGLPQMPRHLRAWRKPRRDMLRPQAPVKGYAGGWMTRWAAIRARETIYRMLSGLVA